MKNSEHHLRILYADSNEDACDMVTTMLGISGIEVITAKTTADAWRLAQSKSFDLYLLDLHFPDGNGLDLCRSLREYAPSAPILFYSGYAFKTDIESGLAAGADVYLTKPYMGDLPVIIQQTIGLTENVAHESHNNYSRIG